MGPLREDRQATEWKWSSLAGLLPMLRGLAAFALIPPRFYVTFFSFSGPERPTMFSCLKTSVVRFLQHEDGPTAVEYAVMLALIIVVCITAITALGSNANVTFTSVGNAIGSAGS